MYTRRTLWLRPKRRRATTVGTWLSLVERTLGVGEVASSNLVVPTISALRINFYSTPLPIRCTRAFDPIESLPRATCFNQAVETSRPALSHAPDIRLRPGTATPIGPSVWPRLRSGALFRENAAEFLLANARQFGDLVAYSALGRKVLQFNHPELIQEMLVRDAPPPPSQSRHAALEGGPRRRPPHQRRAVAHAPAASRPARLSPPAYRGLRRDDLPSTPTRRPQPGARARPSTSALTCFCSRFASSVKPCSTPMSSRRCTRSPTPSTASRASFRSPSCRFRG